MPRSKQPEFFFLILKDNDGSLFTVLGPMADDTSWNAKVCAAQDKGRNVSCYSVKAHRTRQQVIANAQLALGLEYTDKIFV